MLAHRALPGSIAAATVDHGLRRESADEAAMVARLCAERGIAHDTLAVTVPAEGNRSANARRERYRALGDWARRQNITAVATAHHSDDQAETLLMRLNRGSGLKGLAAMRESRPMPTAADIALVRPLLQWSRMELAAICRAEGLTPANDLSNTDPRYDRARIRAAMAEADWLDPDRIALSARHLRDAYEALEEFVDEEFASCVTMPAEGDGASYRPRPRRSGSRMIRYRVLERLFARLGGAPRGTEIERLLATLESGGVATLAGYRCAAHGPANAPEWRLTREGPRKSG